VGLVVFLLISKNLLPIPLVILFFPLFRFLTMGSIVFFLFFS
jgi:hypothetical protein